MKDQTALVSIGVPTYNRPQGLRRTLSCLIKQTYPSLEIIVSDNCSPSSDTAQVVAEFMTADNRIRYFRQDQPIAISKNFQFVLRQASGQYFMWAADDDEWAPNFVLSCLGAMDQCSVSAMSAFDTYYRQAETRTPNVMPKLSQSSSILENLIAFLSCMTPSLFYGLHKREAISFFLQEEMFDYYDCYFAMRLIASGGISLVFESLYTAGIDAKAYKPKPMSKSWGSGLRVLPFYRATRLLFAETPLAMVSRLKLQVKLATIVLRLLIVNEGRAFFYRTREVLS